MIYRFILCLLLAVVVNTIIQTGLAAIGLHNSAINFVVGLIVGFITYTVMSDWINDR